MDIRYNASILDTLFLILFFLFLLLSMKSCITGKGLSQIVGEEAKATYLDVRSGWRRVR